MTGVARIIGLLIALALLLSLLLPLVGASAQEATEEEDVATTEALAEVPTTGARRPGPDHPRRDARRRAGAGAGAGARASPRSRCRSTASASTPRSSSAPSSTERCTTRAVPGSSPGTSSLGKVGEGGNVVMAGHVDYWNVGPAVFWDVRNLPAGDVIRVVGEDGKNYEYAVEWIERYDAARTDAGGHPERHRRRHR